MAKQFWSFKPSEDHTDLYMLTDIAGEESWWSDSVSPQSFRRQLYGLNGEIHLWLYSPGGDAFAGAMIYDMIREYSRSGRGKVVAMVSLAASAASIIAMACDEIRISVMGTIMIHEPWSLAAGPAREHIATAKVLETIRDGQIDAYVMRTGLSREKVLELMQGPDGNGTYMNANMAIELGFADSVISDGEDGDAISSLQKMRVQSSIASAAELIAARAQAEEDAPDDDEDENGEDAPDEPEKEEDGEDDGDDDRAKARAALMRAYAMSYQ